ncbi:MAG TPA: PspA/IM30 family protein [Candidatus Angelobacter sp.]|nr:PspA/IM30 family protein [Candidatus Angelobacter sp.]HKR93892.1 PspA/IM30 family protein [Candidatus Angelobacter sp.]
MALLERVSTLIRANLNDLIDKAENPEKLIKQVILDMENQLLQVKTQVAIAIADQHLLEKKQKENEERISDWNRKAELAVGKQQDDLARAAIERGLHYKQLSESFRQQVADQTLQVETLKNALNKLQQKLQEARAHSDLLIAQHRRARTLDKAADAHSAMASPNHSANFDRMKHKVLRQEAVGQAKNELLEVEGSSVEARFAAMEKEDEINRILSELKAKRA